MLIGLADFPTITLTWSICWWFFLCSLSVPLFVSSLNDRAGNWEWQLEQLISRFLMSFYLINSQLGMAIGNDNLRTKVQMQHLFWLFLTYHFFLGTVEERLQRERVRDLSVFERLNGSYGKTSSSLAVKKVISTSFLFIFLACILSRFACSLFFHLFLSELQLWFFHHSSFHAKWQPFSVFFVFCPFVLNFVIFIMSEIFPLMQNAVHPPYLSLVLQNHIYKNHSTFGCAASPSSRRNFELPLKLVGFWWTSFWSGSWLHLW